MRSLALIAFVLVAAVPAGSAAGARLAVIGVSPLAVRGVGFVPRERVRVVATVDGTTTRWSRAGSNGTFVVRFSGVTIPTCTGFVVRAFGAAGSRATAARVPQLECPQPLSP